MTAAESSCCSARIQRQLQRPKLQDSHSLLRESAVGVLSSGIDHSGTLRRRIQLQRLCTYSFHPAGTTAEPAPESKWSRIQDLDALIVNGWSAASERHQTHFAPGSISTDMSACGNRYFWTLGSGRIGCDGHQRTEIYPRVNIFLLPYRIKTGQLRIPSHLARAQCLSICFCASRLALCCGAPGW